MIFDLTNPLYFEHVYTTTPPTAPKCCIQDGRFLWVSGDSVVYVYELIGKMSGHEPGWSSMDELNQFNNPGVHDNKWNLIASIVIPDGAHWLAQGHKNIYVANSTQFNKITIVNKISMEIAQVVDCPEVMNSNLIVDNGKLWMVSKAKEDQLNIDQQRLYQLDELALRFTFDYIPCRKQLARANISSGYNGHVYVTNFNNVSLSKFENVNGSYIGQIRTNAFPQEIVVTPERDILVSSYGGMLTKVNAVTDEVSNIYSTLATAISTAIVGDYVWYVALKPTPPEAETVQAETTVAVEAGGSAVLSSDYGDDGEAIGNVQYVDDIVLGRLNRTDNSLIFTGESKKKIHVNEYKTEVYDWNINKDNLTDTEFSKVYSTLPFQYKQFNGSTWDTIDVKPYLIIIGSTKIMAIRLDHELMRQKYVQLSGQSMISTGSEDYMGEVG